MLGAQPQSLNKVSNFNQIMVQAGLYFCKSNGRAHLISVTIDGVGCDRKFISWTLIRFLRGKICCVALVDSNHNAKNFRYQFISGSCVVVLGINVIDPHLFALAGIEE